MAKQGGRPSYEYMPPPSAIERTIFILRRQFRLHVGY
ncbi:hypothetical protein FOYG_14271 [Fusarium oxysporum NRRL 32931]|uniref:Uncharacterized protein n=1 Tax=Fusarium oxysporum NRRL 32931 TaxID=660029 RepID=W9HMD8_FUSOX|nr:hypothetical protein FOYG_14271 [Fusarium oxysporum NRRL 32931]